MISRFLVDAVKEFEAGKDESQFYEKPVWDYKQWTIGYGTRATSKDQRITKQEAERALIIELEKDAASVDKALAERGWQDQFTERERDALISLQHNSTGWAVKFISGSPGVRPSTDKEDLFKRFPSIRGAYENGNYKVLPGLVRRRETELSWTGRYLRDEPTTEPYSTYVPKDKAFKAPDWYRGNVNLGNLPEAKNDDGTIGSTRSYVVSDQEGAVLVPAIGPKGEQLDEQGAIKQFLKTGKHFGRYPTAEGANAAAESLAKQQRASFGKPEIIGGDEGPKVYSGGNYVDPQQYGRLKSAANTFKQTIVGFYGEGSEGMGRYMLNEGVDILSPASGIVGRIAPTVAELAAKTNKLQDELEKLTGRPFVDIEKTDISALDIGDDAKQKIQRSLQIIKDNREQIIRTQRKLSGYIEAGQAISKWGRVHNLENPNYQKELLTSTLPSVAGSAVASVSMFIAGPAGAGASAAMNFGNEYQQSYDRQIAEGVDPDKAHGVASRVAAINAGLEFAGDWLTAGLFKRLLSPAINKVLKRTEKKVINNIKRLPRARKVAKAGFGEGVTGGSQEYVQEKLQGQKISVKNIATAAALEATGGMFITSPAAVSGFLFEKVSPVVEQQYKKHQEKGAAKLKEELTPLAKAVVVEPEVKLETPTVKKATNEIPFKSDQIYQTEVADAIGQGMTKEEFAKETMGVSEETMAKEGFPEFSDWLDHQEAQGKKGTIVDYELQAAAAENLGFAVNREEADLTKVTTEQGTFQVHDGPPSITPEAAEFLKSAEEGIPATITNNLKRIATENGLVVTDKTTPQDIVIELKRKSNSPPTIVTPITINPQTNVYPEVSPVVKAENPVEVVGDTALEDAAAYNQPEEPDPQLTKDIADQIKATMAQWKEGPVFEIARNYENAPDNIKFQVDQSGVNPAEVEAIYDPGTKKITFFSENISPDRVGPVAVHETVGHHGLAAFMNSKELGEYNRMIDGVFNAAPRDTMIKIGKERGLDYSNRLHKAIGVEEYIAELVENGKIRDTPVERWVNTASKLLRKKFPNMPWNKAEVTDLLKSARQFADRNQSKNVGAPTTLELFSDDGLIREQTIRPTKETLREASRNNGQVEQLIRCVES